MLATRVREALRTYLYATLIPIEENAWPADDSDLLEAGLDSLRLMQLLVFAEEKWKMKLPDHEVTPERIESIDALVAWFETHLNQ